MSHGVYKPGNVHLETKILHKYPGLCPGKIRDRAKPGRFCFPRRFRLRRQRIREAIGYGVVKFNIDTDLQWAFWDGVRGYYQANEGYLQAQIGNPEGADLPNKSYYDPTTFG